MKYYTMVHNYCETTFQSARHLDVAFSSYAMTITKSTYKTVYEWSFDTVKIRCPDIVCYCLVNIKGTLF